MLGLLSRPEGAANGLSGFEVPARQPAFGVPAAALCVDDEIRCGHMGHAPSSIDGTVCERSRHGIELITGGPGQGTSTSRSTTSSFDTQQGGDGVDDRVKLGAYMSQDATVEFGSTVRRDEE